MKELADAPELKKVWLEKLKKEAGSSSFDIANKFAANAPDLDDQFSDLLKPKDAFELVVAVCDAADTGAFTSIDLRGGQFSAVPNLKKMAATYAKKSPITAGKLVGAKAVSKDLKSFVEAYLSEDS